MGRERVGLDLLAISREGRGRVTLISYPHKLIDDHGSARVKTHVTNLVRDREPAPR